MRDAIGSAWVFSICLTFIILFTCYLAISLNYAKAFRVKNHIISMIEENEGYGKNKDELTERIESYLGNEGYTTRGQCEPYIQDQDETEWALEECLNGDNPQDGKCYVCLYRKAADNKKNAGVGAERAYYRVITFFRFDLPVISAYMPPFQVGGDSRYIHDFANGS